MQNSHSKSAFTLVELLVALSIATIVILMVGLVFIQGIRHTRVISAEARLVDTASHLTNVATHAVRTGTDLETPASDTLIITYPDNSTTQISLTSGEIQLNGANILPDNIIPNYIDFTLIGSTVQIAFEFATPVGSVAGYTVEPLAGTTTISLRN